MDDRLPEGDSVTCRYTLHPDELREARRVLWDLRGSHPSSERTAPWAWAFVAMLLAVALLGLLFSRRNAVRVGPWEAEIVLAFGFIWAVGYGFYGHRLAGWFFRLIHSSTRDEPLLRERFITFSPGGITRADPERPEIVPWGRIREVYSDSRQVLFILEDAWSAFIVPYRVFGGPEKVGEFFETIARYRGAVTAVERAGR